MVEYPAQTLKGFNLLSCKTPLQFCCFWELSKGKVSWPLAEKAAKLLNLFAAREWGSCCDHTVRESTTFGNEHSCTESNVQKKTLENPITFKNSLLMKIILTRTPGNLLSHWKPIFKLFLSLLYFISFSKMDFFSPQMRSQFLFRLGQWRSWRGWQKQAASQTITQKTFSQDIYNKYRHQVWGLPFPGSIAVPVFSLEGIYYISGLGNVYWDGLIRVENHSTERGFSSPGWTRCSQLGSCWGMSLISHSLQLLSAQC